MKGFASLLVVATVLAAPPTARAESAASSPPAVAGDDNAQGAGGALPTYRRPLKLDLSFGYGLSYASSMLAAGFQFQDSPEDEALGRKLSTNLLRLELSGTYSLTQNIELNFGLPFGVVQVEAPEGTLPGISDLSNFKVAAGEVSLGVAGLLLDEDARHPAVTVAVSGETANARYTSLGDGRYNVTAAATVSKTAGRRISLLGIAGASRSLARATAPARTTSFVSGGAGFLSPRGRYRLLVRLDGYRQPEPSTPASAPSARTTNRNDYALSVGVAEAGTRHAINVHFFAPQGQLSTKENAIGVTYTMPIWPREPKVKPRPG